MTTHDKQRHFFSCRLGLAPCRCAWRDKPRTLQHGGTGEGFPEMPLEGPSGPASVSPPVVCGAVPRHETGRVPPNHATAEPPVTFTTAVHRASVRNGIWVPWCAGEGWDAPLASEEHPEQVTCFFCQQASDTGAPPVESAPSAGWRISCLMCENTFTAWTTDEIVGWVEGHRHCPTCGGGDIFHRPPCRVVDGQLVNHETVDFPIKWKSPGGAT